MTKYAVISTEPTTAWEYETDDLVEATEQFQQMAADGDACVLVQILDEFPHET